MARGFLSGMQQGGGGGVLDGLAKKMKGIMGGGGDSSDDSGGGFYGSELTSYHKGGMVKKTGPAMLKRGERVLTKAQQKRIGAKRRGK